MMRSSQGTHQATVLLWLPTREDILHALTLEPRSHIPAPEICCLHKGAGIKQVGKGGEPQVWECHSKHWDITFKALGT